MAWLQVSDYTQNLIPNQVIENELGFPTYPTEGSIYYNLNTKDVYFYAGTASGWKSIASWDMLSTGCLESLEPTRGSNSITCPAQYVAIHNNATYQGHPLIKYVQGKTFTIPSDGLSWYVTVSFNGGSPEYQLTSNASLINNSSIIPIWACWATNADVHLIGFDSKALGLANKIDSAILNTIPYRRSLTGGLILTVDSSRHIVVSAATVYAGTTPQTISTYNSTTDKVTLAYHDLGQWKFASVGFGYQINNNQYDNGTNLITSSNNKYLTRYIFRSIGDDKECFVAYGSSDYNTLAQAELEQVPAIPGVVSSHSMLVGRVIIQYNASTVSSVESAFNTLFQTSTVLNHNDLGNIQGGAPSEYYHLNQNEKLELTLAGDTAYHYHTTDRNRANHSGTQLSSTISNWNAASIASTLTSFVTGANSAIVATDSILQAFQKTQGQLNNRLSGNQTITLSGDITGSGTTSIATTLATTGTSGTYTKVTTDSKGRVTSGTTLSASDIPVLDATKITTGVFDVARIPVLPSQLQITSSGSIANLTSGQQSQIGQGTVVTTTDGRRWVYSGTGSKTLETSYVELADVTPEWTVIANKPTFVNSFNSRTGAVSPQSGDYTTSIVGEGTNLYFTESRARTAMTGAITNITASKLTASRVCITDASGNIAATSAVTPTHLSYLVNVTSDIQTQFSGKQDSLTTGAATQYFKGNLSLGTFQSDVRSTVLTGLSLNNSSILSTDAVVDAFSKTQGQLNNKQGLNSNLTSLAGLTYTSSSFVKMTGTNSFALDSSTYLTSNQTITLSGIVTGSGTTSITTSIADAALSIAKTSGLQTALNGKQATLTTGTSSQYFKGDLSLGTFASDVRSTLLTGLSLNNVAIVATDSILTAFGKTQGQLNGLVNLDGTQTITGLKTFYPCPVIGGASGRRYDGITCFLTNNNTSTKYTKLFTLPASSAANASIVTISGYVSGVQYGEGRAKIDVVFQSRDFSKPTGSIIGSMGICNIELWRESDNSFSVYASTGVGYVRPWNLTISGDFMGGTSNATYVYTDGSETTTPPTGTQEWNLTGGFVTRAYYNQSSNSGLVLNNDQSTGNTSLLFAANKINRSILTQYADDGLFKLRRFNASGTELDTALIVDTTDNLATHQLCPTDGQKLKVGLYAKFVSNMDEAGSNFAIAIDTIQGLNIGWNRTAGDRKATFISRVPTAYATKGGYSFRHYDETTERNLLDIDYLGNSTFLGAIKGQTLTASTVPYIDSSKKIVSSSVTPTELGYVSGVTSAIQTQLNNKQSIAAFASDVRSTVLTGFSTTNSAILATDSILTAFGKTQGQINICSRRQGFNATDGNTGRWVKLGTLDIYAQYNSAYVHIIVDSDHSNNFNNNWKEYSAEFTVGFKQNDVMTNTHSGVDFTFIRGTNYTSSKIRIVEEQNDATRKSVGIYAQLSGILTYDRMCWYTIGAQAFTTSGNGVTPIADPNVGALPEFAVTDKTHYTSGALNSPTLTASTALIADASKNIISSSVTSTELGYISGVTSSIQTQLNTLKASKISSQCYISAADDLIPFSDRVTRGNVFGRVNTGLPSGMGYFSHIQILESSGTAYGAIGMAIKDGNRKWFVTDSLIPVANEPTNYFELIHSGTLNTAALGVLLTGFSATNSAIVATDSILVGFNKTQGQLNNKQASSTNLTSLAGLTYASSSFVKMTGANTFALDTNTYLTQSSFNTGNPDLSAIEALSGTSGLLKKTAANTWSLDTNTYLTGNQTITLSGIITGSGTTSITTSIADAALSIAKTSGLQTALDGKQATITGGATSIATSNLTASRALASDASGKVAVSSVTSTELGYVSGVTSSIQTQITSLKNRVLYSNSTNGGYNGTTETAITTVTIPANTITAYGTLRVRVSGYVNLNASGTGTFKIKLGGNTIFTYTKTLGDSDDTFTVELLVGPSKVTYTGHGYNDGLGVATTSLADRKVNTYTYTSSADLVCTAQGSVASNGANIDFIIVEVL